MDQMNDSRQSLRMDEMLRIVMDASPVEMLLFDENECVVYANPLAGKLFGKKAMPPGVLKCGDFIACENRHTDPQGCGHGPACPMCPLSKAVRSALSTNGQGDDLRPGNSGEALLNRDPGVDPLWVKFNARNISMGGQSRVLMVVNDITAEKRSEADLFETHALLSNAFRKAAIGMAIFGTDGVYRQVNAAFCEMLGYDETEMLTRSFLDITYRDDAAMSTRAAKMMIDGKTDQDLFEKRYVHKNGSVVHVQVTMALLRDQHHAPQYFFTQIQNITHQRALKSQLEQAQKMESIGTLAGGIAHDFNNILSSIIGYTELAADMAENQSRQSRYLKEVLTAGNRAKELVSQILTFARQSEVEAKPIRARYLVKESMKLLRASIPSSIAIREFIQSDTLILANPTQIHQVVMNLCTNAAQAMEEQGGTLNVELKDVVVDKDFLQPSSPLSCGKYLLLSIGDTGQGIGPDILGKIFDPYFTTKAKSEGTGLGLSVVKGIVDSCRGMIDVHTEMGKGTQFDIYFPALEFQAKEKTASAEAPKIAAGNERILFVDDERPIAALSEQMLSSLGYQVVVRTSPLEALELFKADPARFDLVISDITMPHMTGDALAAEIIGIRPDLPVILCTGYSKRISDERAKEIGVKAFLFKPIVKSQLAEAIRKVLDEANGKG